MLELRDVHFRQHSRRGVDIEHLLDGHEIRCGTGVPAEIVVLEQVGFENRNRCFQHFGNDLECFLAIGQGLFHARRDIAHVGLDQVRIFVDEVGAAGLENVDDVWHFL